MKILLFGKTRNIARLVEDPAEDLRLAGHDVRVFAYRSSRLAKSLDRLLLAPTLGVPLARLLARQVRAFRPDLILAFGPFHWLPPAIFEPIVDLPHRPPIVAWIGDRFGEEAQATARLFDLIAYTDSGFIEHHKALNFSAPPLFVPLAATRGAVAPEQGQRSPHLAFVGSATDNRRALLAAVPEPIALFGPDWRDAPAQHRRDTRRVNGPGLAAIYRSHVGVLNVRHDRNVINGLNQRHFAPYVQATPVVADAQADLERCFDPGREIMVYRDAAELTEICAELRRDPARAATIGVAGQRRVLAEHTYAHRIATVAGVLGVA